MNARTKSLISYIFPALGGLFVTYLYNVVDGIFVGMCAGAAASAALPMFALSFVPMALNLIYTAYFFSTKRTGTADAIAVSRGIALKALMIFCLPLLFGTGAIWLAPLATELLTLAAVVLSRTSRLVYR